MKNSRKAKDNRKTLQKLATKYDLKLVDLTTEVGLVKKERSFYNRAVLNFYHDQRRL